MFAAWPAASILNALRADEATEALRGNVAPSLVLEHLVFSCGRCARYGAGASAASAERRRRVERRRGGAGERRALALGSRWRRWLGEGAGGAVAGGRRGCGGRARRARAADGRDVAAGAARSRPRGAARRTAAQRQSAGRGRSRRATAIRRAIDWIAVTSPRGASAAASATDRGAQPRARSAPRGDQPRRRLPGGPATIRAPGASIRAKTCPRDDRGPSPPPDRGDRPRAAVFPRGSITARPALETTQSRAPVAR